MCVCSAANRNYCCCLKPLIKPKKKEEEKEENLKGNSKMMESGNDGAGVGLFVWIKSMANVIVGAAAAVAGGGAAEGDNCGGGGGDSCASSYHTLPNCPAAVLGDNEVEKTSKTKTKQIISGADRNNNSAAERAKQANGSAVSTSHRSSNGKMSGGANGGGNFQRLRDDDESGSSSSSSSFSFNEEGEKVIHKPQHHHHHPQASQSKHIPQTRAKLISENDDDSTTTTLPCCDIMKAKHQLCGNGSFRRTSPPTAEIGGVALQNGSNVVNGSTTSTTTKIPSNKIIEAIIEVIKKGELIRKFDPLVETKTANFHISPLGKLAEFVCFGLFYSPFLFLFPPVDTSSQ